MKQKLDIDREKLLDEWGTIKRFCNKNGINYNTYKVVRSGYGSSKRIVSILKKHGYLKKRGKKNA